MLADPEKAALAAAWEPARRAGVLGNASIEELWEHTAGFTTAVCSAFSAECSTWNGRILDAGTGAGIPGVLLARQFPEAEVTLVDSSERRLDHARAAVRALGVTDRVQIQHARMDDLAHKSSHRSAYEVVVARLLAEPPEAAELLLPCVLPGGVAVVSCRRQQLAEWRTLPEVISAIGSVEALTTAGGAFVIVSVTDELPSIYPRRSVARSRKPLI